MKSLFYSMSYVAVTSVVFLFSFMLLRFPDIAGEGIKKGIELCLYTLFPSMYPFMFISSFITASGLSKKSERLFSYFTEKFFRLPGVCGSLIILSMIGGLPVGGKMVSEMYDKGYIAKEQGQRLLMFCINPGPAFVITSVGYYMIGSKKAGIIIFVSLVLSSLTVGFLTRFVYQNDEMASCKFTKNKVPDIQKSIVSSVTDSGRGMLNVCAWVILFSCVSQLISLLPLSDGMKMFLGSVLEITNGCQSAVGILPLPVIAGIIGFSGICAHLQIMSSVVKLSLPLKHFLSARVINAALAIIYSLILFEIFPVSVQTIKIGALPSQINSQISVPVCIGIMFMCILLLLGENCKIRKNAEN